MKIKDIVTLMAVMATAVGCTQEAGEQLEEGVPIQLATTIAQNYTKGTVPSVYTRAAGDWGERTTTMTQGTEFLNGEPVDVYIKEHDGDHTADIEWPIACQVVNDGDGDADDGDLTSSTPIYYPNGVNIIQMHAIHPSYTSGTGFTVQTDQTTEADYAASDLCYSKPTDYARTGSVDDNGRRVLQFKHLLSKIVVNLTIDDNVTGASLPSNIKIHAKTSTAMAFPADNDNGYTGCAASDAGDPAIIIMKQEAIIPPQTIAAGTTFLSFGITGIGPMYYPLPAETTFESGKMYTYNIRVKNTGIAVTTNVTDWETKTENQAVRAHEVDIKLNPLWWMAQYNMAQNKTSFVDEHSTSSQYVFNWSDAKTANVSGYHLPTFAEQVSIVPCDKESNSATDATNIFNYTETLSNPREFSEVACTVGGSNVSANTSVIGKNADADYYAVRFIGTDYATAWHYKWVTSPDSPCNGMLIESYQIICMSVTEAKTILAGLASSAIFTGSYPAGTANQSPTSTTATNSGFTQRFLPACGLLDNNSSGGSGTADNYIGSTARYWAVTSFGSSLGWSWLLQSDYLREYGHWTQYGLSVRLFRDN